MLLAPELEGSPACWGQEREVVVVVGRNLQLLAVVEFLADEHLGRPTVVGKGADPDKVVKLL